MNILMIYPEMPDTIGKFSDMVKMSGRKASFPPIGLLTVASLLPKDWQIKLIDLNVQSEYINEFEWADLIFISAMNVQAKSAREVINICKQHNKKVVAGGPLFTHEYEKFPNVDHFVLNEAELTLGDFISDLEKAEAREVYKSAKFADTHQTPVPKWDLINLNDYIYSLIQFSRGCPYLCDFCDVTALYGRVPRTKSTEQIINELDVLIASGKNEMIFFADDNLIGNKNILKKELLPALIDWRDKNKFAPAFATQLTITLADDEELIQLLLEAGFRHILIGIESIDPDALMKMRKKQNTKRDLLQNVLYLQEKGFIIIGTFIVGLDDDTEEVFANLVKFIQQSGIVLVVVNVLKAPPGTELFERMKSENRLVNEFEFEFDEDRTNIIPVMDKMKLHNGYKKVLSSVYDPENVFNRIVSYYKNLNRPKVKNSIHRKVSLKELFAFLGILYKLGIEYDRKKYFWKLVFWTLKYNYNYLDLSLLFAIQMYQYSHLMNKFEENERKGIFIFSEDKVEAKS